MPSFYIHTYGCQMNAHESERLAHMLQVGGLLCAQNPDEADILIFQTCSVRDTAARKILTHIAQAKKKWPKKKICVIGCLSATQKIKNADIVLGTNQLELLVEKLCSKDSSGKFSCESCGAPRAKSISGLPSLIAHSQENLPGESLPNNLFGIGNSIIITHGCENFCSYCIVPYARGKEYSRDIDDILFEFNQIIEKNSPPIWRGGRAADGVVWLLGQNVNSYRCPRTGTDFVGLLDRICAIDGNFVLNFMSSHPKDFDKRLVDCIARNPKIERNIHLPMQSGSDKILKLMNRGYTVAQYREKIKMLRAAVPGVRITTDIICGFPGETEADFQETVKVFKELRFNAAFIFPYSPREGTAAAKMPDQIATGEKKRRTTMLLTNIRVDKVSP